jgi:hypothetical protein
VKWRSNSSSSGNSDAVAQLHAEARRDYGTPEERQQRQADARGGLADARNHANASAGTPRGRR